MLPSLATIAAIAVAALVAAFILVGIALRPAPKVCLGYDQPPISARICFGGN